MPPVSRQDLQLALLEAITESGGIGLVEPSTARHPLRFLISFENNRVSLWVYIWTLTPGGRRSLPDEYRIQMTTVESPLPINPQDITVLMGYEPNLRMLAGFDLSRHPTFTPGSSSVQINIRALNSALQDGLGFERKANDEIAIGIRPDHFLFYCQHHPELHLFGSNSTALDLLTRAASLEEITSEDVETLSQERQRVVRETSRWARSTNFRLQVINAYGSRCAVTRWQLRLVEAAHILPVSAGVESLDDVRNGIALLPTYHRALDRGLIYLDENLEMRINTEQANELRQVNMDSGLNDIEASLGRIHLPPDRRQWPDVNFVRRANEYRGII